MFSWAKKAERAAFVDAVATPRSRVSGTDTQANKAADTTEPLRLLSFNIQTGIKTSKYRQYVTKGWKHVLPHHARQKNLTRIADVIAGYDVVGLQEIDMGSLRSGFMNQVEYLAFASRFPYWYAQLNRDIGPFAQQGNGLLSRREPTQLEDHKLPGLIPGRGAVVLRIPYAGDELVVVMLHLSLGERSRRRQLDYIAEQIEHERQVVVMGDMNTPLASLMAHSKLKCLDLAPAAAATSEPTYPSWRPVAALDHVLLSPNLTVNDFQVLNCRLSDHRPIAVEISARTRPAIQ